MAEQRHIRNMQGVSTGRQNYTRYDTIRYDTVEINVRSKADGMASLI